jgi:serine O-acetyltransferase
VLGPIRIGAGARIGANAVVVQDVPAGAVAIGVPAKLVLSDYGSDGAPVSRTTAAAARALG